MWGGQGLGVSAERVRSMLDQSGYVLTSRAIGIVPKYLCIQNLREVGQSPAERGEHDRRRDGTDSR